MKWGYLGIILVPIISTQAMNVSIPTHMQDHIAQQIWHNESSQNPHAILDWNEGEKFLSVGIFHMTWKAKGAQTSIESSFPNFLKFVQLHRKLPECLQKNSECCPWRTREEFFMDRSPAKKILRQFLEETIELQKKFLFYTLNKMLPAMIDHSSSNQEREHVRLQFDRMVKSPGGLYALSDYFNCKGLGLYPQKDYKGHRWGLFQVLRTMNGKVLGKQAILDFVAAAKRVLAERVKLAPKQQQSLEAKWLLGWYNRLDTYLHHAAKK